MNIIKEIKRYLTLILGLIVLSATYNLFILPNNIVTGGVSGLAVALQDLINPSIFMFIVNAVLITISFLILGVNKTKDFVLGALLFPLFVYLTSNVADYIKIADNDLVLNIIFAATLSGASVGLIIKNGFSTGGSDIAASIMSKLAKRSIGKSILIIDSLIILSGLFAFGIIKTMYAIIFVYIYSVITDKFILGVSDNKAFYIITSEEDEVKKYIFDQLHHGASILKAHGGYKNDKKNVIFCVIPSRQYFKLKEGIAEIDPNAFFIVTDAYEVIGGA